MNGQNYVGIEPKHCIECGKDYTPVVCSGKCPHNKIDVNEQKRPDRPDREKVGKALQRKFNLDRAMYLRHPERDEYFNKMADEALYQAEKLGYRKLSDRPELREKIKGALLSDELLEIGRKAIEDVLIEWRDSRLSEFTRGNGVVIREKDGKDSNIIRFGPETALKIGIKAMLKHPQCLALIPDIEAIKKQAADTIKGIEEMYEEDEANVIEEAKKQERERVMGILHEEYPAIDTWQCWKGLMG